MKTHNNNVIILYHLLKVLWSELFLEKGISPFSKEKDDGIF